MTVTVIAAAYRAGQELDLLPKDVILFPFLILLAWGLILYGFFTSRRATRFYRKAYKEWAKEKRGMAYALAVGVGAIVGGATGAGWWKLFEMHRQQVHVLQTRNTPPPAPVSPSVPAEPEELSEQEQLADNSIALAAQILQLYDDWNADVDNLTRQKNTNSQSGADPEQIKTANSLIDVQITGVRMDAMREWRNKYADEARKFRDQLLAPNVLPPGSRDRTAYDMYDDPTPNPQEYAYIAKDLARMGNLLKEQLRRAKSRPQSPRAQASTKPPLSSFTDGQRFVLKQKLHAYSGSNVRLIIVGNDPQNQILFEQLIDIFKDAEWKTETGTIGTASIVGENFPVGSYLTGVDVSIPLITAVFTIFSNAGVNLPLVPDAWAGPLSMGTAEVAIVVH